MIDKLQSELKRLNGQVLRRRDGVVVVELPDIMAAQEFIHALRGTTTGAVYVLESTIDDKMSIMFLEGRE